MAKILKELPAKRGGAGRKPIYPYDQWLDGQIWCLESGTDFTAKPASVLASCRGAAESRGLRLATRFMNDGKDVVIQALPKADKEQEEAASTNGTTVPKSNRRAKTATPA